MAALLLSRGSLFKVAVKGKKRPMSTFPKMEISIGSVVIDILSFRHKNLTNSYNRTVLIILIPAKFSLFNKRQEKHVLPLL